MSSSVTIGEVLTALIDYRGKTPVKTSTGVPLITAKVIKGGRITSDRKEFIAEDSYDSWMRRGLPRTGDVLITTEAPLGEVAQIGNNARVALAQRVILLRPNPEMIDPQFFFHFLRSPVAQERLRQRSSGTTVAGIRQPELRSIEIDLLPRGAQEKVGAVIDALDRSIENSRRRIELLEQMAQATYREWFVNFRYPGHENATFVDSPVGPIPDGWAVRRLGELAQIEKGLSYKGEHLSADGVTMANLKCIRPHGGFRRDGTKPYSGPAKHKHSITSGEIIMANTDLTQVGGVIGSAALVPRAGFEEGGIISHHLFAIRPHQLRNRQWLVHYFNDRPFREFARGVASGTTVLGLRPADVERCQLAVPSDEIAELFERFSSNISDLGEELNGTAEAVCALRDLLLPKLVTGEIDVSQLDLDALVGAAS